MFPMSDNECSELGWVEYIVSDLFVNFHVSAPQDADLDDEIFVFNHDEQEMIRVQGWALDWERITD